MTFLSFQINYRILISYFAEKPNQWANLYSNCGGTRQSPIDLPVKNVPHCDPQMKEEGFVRNSRVVGHDAQWEVENTGRFSKIVLSKAKLLVAVGL